MLVGTYAVSQVLDTYYLKAQRVRTPDRAFVRASTASTPTAPTPPSQSANGSASDAMAII